MDTQEKRIEELQAEVNRLKQELNNANSENGKSAIWFQKVLDQLPNPLFIKDFKSRFVNINAAFETFTGYTKEDVIGNTDSDFFPEAEAEVFLSVDKEILSFGGTNWNEESITIEGQKFDLLTSKTRVFDASNNKFLLGVITDITDKENQHVLLKHKQEELEKEKENNHNLLKEIHHRVKNNLQVISSLLNLQMQVFSDEVVQKSFENCKGRILAMANVHEILYKTGNFSNINFSIYIKSLITNLKSAYEVENSIQFKTNLINIFLNVDIAIPLGMAINEIVINSIKHGAIDGKLLTIFINFHKVGNIYKLEIGDDGKGGMPKLDAEEVSFGTELIKLFCNQIQANVDLHKTENTMFYSIEFEKTRSKTLTTRSFV